MRNILHSPLKTQKNFDFWGSDSKIFCMLTKKNIEHRPCTHFFKVKLGNMKEKFERHQKIKLMSIIED